MKKIISIIVTYLLLSLPAFAVTNLKDDSNTHFTDHIGKGKWTVLEIWSHNCHSCRKNIHHLSDFDAIGENYNAHVIGISLDGPERKAQAKAFVENQALEFPNLLANVQEVEQFIHKHAPQSPLATPTVMMFSPEGEFAGIVVGPVTTNQLTQYFDEQEAAEIETEEVHVVSTPENL